MSSFATSSPVASDTLRYRIRAPVFSSSWLKRTSLLFVAETSFTGTLTSPKPTVPDQIALGMSLGSHVVPVPSNTSRSEATKTVIEVEGAGGTVRQLTLSNLDKVLYPEVGFTKAAV